MARCCYSRYTGPTSLTAEELEQWVVLEVGLALLVVVGVRGQTKTVQGHIVTTQEWVIKRDACPMGLVPGFAAYPSLTTVELEQAGVMVVVKEGVTHLSVD